MQRSRSFSACVITSSPFVRMMNGLFRVVNLTSQLSSECMAYGGFLLKPRQKKALQVGNFSVRKQGISKIRNRVCGRSEHEDINANGMLAAGLAFSAHGETPACGPSEACTILVTKAFSESVSVGEGGQYAVGRTCGFSYDARKSCSRIIYRETL